MINNSFGTNIRYTAKGASLPVNNVRESEFEYFLFKKNPNPNGKDFVDAAWDAIQGKNVVQIFTTGNRDMKNPYYRPLYPYFNPDAEDQWIAVTGLKQLDTTDTNGNPKYDYWYGVNKAGDAKWWTVAAPGAKIYSSIVVDDHYVASDANHKLGDAGYATFGGTSMAAPHVAGAMAVLMQRYPDMTAPQVREVMFTTANHKNSDGSNFDSWTVGENEVDPLFGWGVPDLDKGMYGPGQLLKNFEYQIREGNLDVWSNNIVQDALEQRKAEDKKWKEEIKYCLDDSGKVVASKIKLDDAILYQGDIPGLEKDKITEDEARKWIADYYEKRLKAVNERENLDGSLTKSGKGTLIMTGANSYKGATTVKAGTLLAFAESIGTDNKVKVDDGGTFGVLSSYNDQFTKKGHLYSTDAQKGELKIEIDVGGTLAIDATSNVVVDSVTFNGAKKFEVTLEGADTATLVDTWNGKKDALTGSFQAKNTVNLFSADGETLTTALKSNYIFFDLDKAEGKGNQATISMKKKDGVTFEQFAGTANEQKIAAAIEASGNKLTGEILSAKTENEIRDTYRALDDDFYATARNALVVNATAVSRTVMDQARGMGEGRSAEVDNGRARIWAAGIGHWGEAEGNLDTMDVDFRAGFLGLLHMDIVQERLEREYNMDLITTAPSVVYEVLQTDGTVVHVENPSKLPPVDKIDEIREPIDTVTIFVPDEYVGAVMKLCQDKRGIQTNLAYHGRQVHLTYELPLAEIVLDFFDRMKSMTRGYASMDYEFKEYRASDVVRVDMLINGDRVDALSSILHRSNAIFRGREIAQRLRSLIPRQMYEVSIQAAIGANIIARENVKALRKNVLAKCYGGDITRKRKLLEKQKAGKKRMKQVGSVEIPQEAFLAILQQDEQ